MYAIKNSTAQYCPAMPSNNKKEDWKPLAIDFNRAVNDSTTAEGIVGDEVTQNSSQRPKLAKFEDVDNAESEKPGNASSKEPKSRENPSSRIPEASSTSKAGAHDGEGKDSKEPCDPGNDEDVDTGYEDGEIERDHTARASGRRLDYDKRFNISQRSRN